MLFSRILIFSFSILFLSSCTFPGSKTGDLPKIPVPQENQNINSGVVNSKDTGSVSLNTNTGLISSISPDNQAIVNSNSLTDTSEPKAISPGLIRNIAIDEGEKDNCLKKFDLLLDQQNCIDNFYMKKAMISKKIVVCNDIVNATLKDTCRDNMLLQDITSKSDLIRCKEIKNPETAGNCFAIVGRQIQSQDKNTEGKSIDPCVGIIDKEIKSACSESIIFNEAVRLRDSAMCKTLVREMKQSMCANLIKLTLENDNPLK